MPRAATLRVAGLRDLNRAFVRAPKTLKKEWRAGQREIAEPTRRMAEYRALTEIRRMPRSPGWAGMRTGVTQKYVYVAPRKRGTKTRRHQRTNLADLMMDRAMQPALEHNAMQIFRDFDGFLAAVGRDWER